MRLGMRLGIYGFKTMRIVVFEGAWCGPLGPRAPTNGRGQNSLVRAIPAEGFSQGRPLERGRPKFFLEGPELRPSQIHAQQRHTVLSG